jgi:hypothetical protein
MRVIDPLIGVLLLMIPIHPDDNIQATPPGDCTATTYLGSSCLSNDIRAGAAVGAGAGVDAG